MSMSEVIPTHHSTTHPPPRYDTYSTPRAVFTHNNTTNMETNQSCTIEPVRMTKLAILAIACFGVGLFVGTRVSVPTVSDDTGGDFAAGFEAARAKLVKGGYIPDPATMPTTSVTGVVKDTAATSLTVSRSGLDMLDDPRDITITVDSNTEIVRITPKDPEVYQQEMSAYEQALAVATGENRGIPELAYPSGTIRTPIVLSDVSQGSTVTVYTSEPVTRDATSFAARTIEVAAPVPGQEPVTIPEITPASVPEPLTTPEAAQDTSVSNETIE